MKHYAVVGNPIQHSLSPQIHTLFAKQVNKIIQYNRELIPLAAFETHLAALQQKGLHGINITAPFKQQAFLLADNLSERALEAGAINTLTFQPDGKKQGDNTDGIGFTRDLHNNLKFSIRSKKILLLGAGGAARGIIGPFLREQPSLLMIVNRDEQKAIQLAQLFKNKGSIESYSWDVLKADKFDLIINATSHLSQESLTLLSKLLHSNLLCYELSYGQNPSSFIRLAQAHGTYWVNGLGMLIEQAAEAFYLWHDIRPQVSSVFAILKQHFMSNVK